MGPPSQPANPNTIQQRIDSLLIAHQYATATQKTPIQKRIQALTTALEYATAV